MLCCNLIQANRTWIITVIWEQIHCGQFFFFFKCTCTAVWKLIFGFSWYSGEEKKTTLVVQGKCCNTFIDYESSLDFLLPCGLVDIKRTFTFGWAYPLRHLISIFFGSYPHKSNVCMWSLVTCLVCLWDNQIFPSQFSILNHFKMWKGNSIHYFAKGDIIRKTNDFVWISYHDHFGVPDPRLKMCF